MQSFQNTIDTLSPYTAILILFLILWIILFIAFFIRWWLVQSSIFSIDKKLSTLLDRLDNNEQLSPNNNKRISTEDTEST